MSKKSRLKPPAQQPDPDVFEAVLHVPDLTKLAELIRKHGLDVDHTRGPKGADPERGMDVEAFVTEAQVRALKDDGVKVEVGRNLSEVGRSRQKQVGAGDRFQGGKLAPKGLGDKPKSKKEG